MTPDEHTKLEMLHSKTVILEHDVSNISDSLREVRADVKEVRATLNQIRGGKSAMWIIWSVIGTILGFIVSLISGSWPVK